MSTVSVQSKKKFVGLIALVGIAAVLAVLFISKQVPTVEVPPMSEDGIPLPFGGTSSKLKGSVNEIGMRNGKVVRYVSFDDGHAGEELQSGTYTNRMDFIVTPDSDTISENAPFPLVIRYDGVGVNDRSYYGYEYLSRDAATETARRDEMIANPAGAYTYSYLFPGTFFAVGGALDAWWRDHPDVNVVPHFDMKLKKNARYVIIANYKSTKFVARGITWCGDGSVQTPNTAGQTEACDDGNTVNTDSCSNSCTRNGNSTWYNAAKPMDVNRDGKVDPTDSAAIINYINTTQANSSGQRPVGTSTTSPSYDVNNDWFVSAADVLLINNAVLSFGYCGDGIKHNLPNAGGDTEECDDGNTNNTDMCSNTCTKNNSAWHNVSKPMDVTNDGMIGTEDIQRIINRINTFGSSLPATGSPPPYYDVNNDWFVTAQDSGMITNYKNGGGIFCGNGITELTNGGEQCDDGNSDDTGDACSNTCTLPPNPFP